MAASKHVKEPLASGERQGRRGVRPGARRGDNAAMGPKLRLLLNGEPRELPAGADVSALLETEGLATRRVAVEVNGDIVPRSRHAGHRLADGDRVEIVHALGGG